MKRAQEARFWQRQDLGRPISSAALVIGLAAMLSLGPGPATSIVILFAALLILARAPGLFLVGAVSFYSATQAVLQDAEIIRFSNLGINASKLFMFGLTGLLGLRILGGLALGESIPRPKREFVLAGLFTGWATVLASQASEAEAIAIAFRLAATLVGFYFAYFLPRRGTPWVPLTIGITAIIAGVSSGLDWTRYSSPLAGISVGAVRVEGSFGGAVSTATIALVGLPVFATWFFSSTKGAYRRLAVIGFGSIAMALAFTLTRAAILGAALFAAFWMVSRDSRQNDMSRAKRILYVSLIVAIMASSFLVVPDRYLSARTEDLSSIGAAGPLDPDAGSGRVLLWRSLFRLMASSSATEILLGHGLNGTLEDLQSLTGLKLGAHNSYLDVVYDLGILGLALYGSLLLSIYWELGRGVKLNGTHRDEIRIWQWYFVVYCVTTILFNGYVYAIGPTWFTFLGVGYALGLARDDAREPLPSQVAQDG